jgi:hypothetical protein
VKFLLTLSVSLAVACSSNVGAQGGLNERDSKYCEEVAIAATEAARMRDADRPRESIEKELMNAHGWQRAEMGATAAFTYRALSDFAMYDFVRTYCRVVSGKEGKLSDFDKLMLSSLYQRNVDCAKQGFAEKDKFIACWNEQARKAKENSVRDPDAIK